MKICIPTEDDAGLNGILAGHFGRAPFFTVVDRATNTAEVIRNGAADHDHGHCNPLEAISRSGAEVVICRGLGRGALARLYEAGVPVFITDDERVSAAVESFEAQGLTNPSLESACGGGGCHGDAHPHH
ncbi:MAG: NifB/NifX family molybdenum-iron cluster-binding protein [Thermoanaerobaculia bacterium]